MSLIKANRLHKGDKIAAISPSWGCAGDSNIYWKYNLGKRRIEENYQLEVVNAPNSLKGSDYLEKNPKARAEDFTWAFENKDIKAVITNIGGNDSIKVVPFINKKTITENPKIFIGYSDAMFLHILCYKANLSTFYGHNLISTFANDSENLHDYSRHWFNKVLFDNSPIGNIHPADSWTCDKINYAQNLSVSRYYVNNTGYKLIQGEGIHNGKLFGGHIYMMNTENTVLSLDKTEFDGSILFIEDIVEYCSPQDFAIFFDWLGRKNFLQCLSGVIIGKFTTYQDTSCYFESMLSIINGKYGLNHLPILADLNFGHTYPICILPYGAKAEINCDIKTFSIIEAGVV